MEMLSAPNVTTIKYHSLEYPIGVYFVLFTCVQHNYTIFVFKCEWCLCVLCCVSKCVELVECLYVLPFPETAGLFSCVGW